MLTNFFNQIPSIDLFSFLLGIFLGAILYFVGSRLRSIYAHLRVAGKKQSEKKVHISSDKTINQFTIDLLRRVQSDHILGALVKLDDIYVPNSLIYPYPYQDPKSNIFDSIEASNLIPFLPEYPALYNSIPFRSCPMISAIKRQNKVLIFGNIGSGKTTLFNHVISCILENKAESASINGFTPFYIHYSELGLDSLEIEDSIEPIYNSLQFKNLNLPKSVISSTFSSYFQEGRAILFFDGLDEADPSTISRFSHWLESLSIAYPLIKLVVSCNLSYSDGFTSAGFVSYYISPLTIGTRKNLSNKIHNLVASFGLNLNQNTYQEFIELTHLKNHQSNFDNFTFTILSLLSEYSLSGQILSSEALLSNYVNRFCDNSSSFSKLTFVAKKMLENSYHCSSKDEISNILGNLEGQTLTDPSVNEHSFFEFLLKLGFFLERKPGYYSFQSSIIMAYLAGKEYIPENNVEWEKYLFDPIQNLTLSFSKENSYIHKWLASKNSPLYKNIDALQAHVEKISADPAFQNTELPVIISTLLSDDVSLAIKLKYLFILSKFNTDTVSKVLDHIYTKSSNNRIFSILGYGFLNNERCVNFLTHIISNGTPLEKALSAISLGRIDHPEARQVLLSSLKGGDDLHRRIVCEVLSLDDDDEYATLKELSIDSNIAIRKASIFGIKLISAPWVVDFLTNMSTNDSEWLVRDSAAAALEEISKNQIELSNPIPEHPSKLEWLLNLAGEQGQGISEKFIPNKLLINLVNNGQLAEKLASLYLLSRYPNKEIIDLFIDLFTEETDLADQAFFYTSEISRRESIV